MTSSYEYSIYDNGNTFDRYLRHDEYERLGTSNISHDDLCALVPIKYSGVVAIDGPTNSGKSTLAQTLARSLDNQGIPNVTIPLDIFLRDRPTRNTLTQALIDGSIDIAQYSIFAWDQHRYDEYLQLAKHLAANSTEPQEIIIDSTYNRGTGTTSGAHRIVVYPGSAILTEGVGIHAYHNDLFDFTVRIDASKMDVFTNRILSRELQKSDQARLPEDFLINRYEAVDRPHTDFLRTASPAANLVADASDFGSMTVYRRLS